MDPAERRVLDAAKACCERWGMAKVTIEDIAAAANVAVAAKLPKAPAYLGLLATRLAESSVPSPATRSA